MIVKLGLHQRLRAVGQRFDKSNADLKARPLALTVERATYFIYPYLLSFKDRIVKTPFSRGAYSSLSQPNRSHRISLSRRPVHHDYGPCGFL